MQPYPLRNVFTFMRTASIVVAANTVAKNAFEWLQDPSKTIFHTLDVFLNDVQNDCSRPRGLRAFCMLDNFCFLFSGSKGL